VITLALVVASATARGRARRGGRAAPAADRTGPAPGLGLLAVALPLGAVLASGVAMFHMAPTSSCWPSPPLSSTVASLLRSCCTLASTALQRLADAGAAVRGRATSAPGA